MKKAFLLLAGLLILYGNAVFSEQAAPLANQPAAVANQPAAEVKPEKEIVIYNASGLRDPFLSIIMAAEIERKIRLTLKPGHPLEEYDISQFKVIAIITEKEKNFAEIGLPNGKYYTVSEGRAVGVNAGKIIGISFKEGVVVREMKKDYTGKEQPVDTILKLR